MPSKSTPEEYYAKINSGERIDNALGGRYFLKIDPTRRRTVEHLKLGARTKVINDGIVYLLGYTEGDEIQIYPIAGTLKNVHAYMKWFRGDAYDENDLIIVDDSNFDDYKLGKDQEYQEAFKAMYTEVGVVPPLDGIVSIVGLASALRKGVDTQWRSSTGKNTSTKSTKSKKSGTRRGHAKMSEDEKFIHGLQHVLKNEKENHNYLNVSELFKTEKLTYKAAPKSTGRTSSYYSGFKYFPIYAGEKSPASADDALQKLEELKTQASEGGKTNGLVVDGDDVYIVKGDKKTLLDAKYFKAASNAIDVHVNIPAKKTTKKTALPAKTKPTNKASTSKKIVSTVKAKPKAKKVAEESSASESESD